MLAILIFLLITVTILSNHSIISMFYSIFELAINEAIIICLNSSAPSMWLIIFVGHAMVIVCQSTYFNTHKLFDSAIFWRLFAEIILILSINILYNNWSFFFEFSCRFLRDLRINVEKILYFI